MTSALDASDASRGLLRGEAEGGGALYDEEFTPVVEMIDQVGLALPDEKPADAYLRVAHERYRLTRERTWDVDVLESLKDRKKRR